MIRSESEYKEARRRLDRDREVAHQQRAALSEAGLAPTEVERAMQPLLSFQAQLEEEVAWYEQARRGTIPALSRLNDIGRILIAARIASGLSQRELADRLGVKESVVSRDERNEYHGITVDRAQRILDALGTSTKTEVIEVGDSIENRRAVAV